MYPVQWNRTKGTWRWHPVSEQFQSSFRAVFRAIFWTIFRAALEQFQSRFRAVLELFFFYIAAFNSNSFDDTVIRSFTNYVSTPIAIRMSMDLTFDMALWFLEMNIDGRHFPSFFLGGCYCPTDWWGGLNVDINSAFIALVDVLFMSMGL